MTWTGVRLKSQIWWLNIWLDKIKRDLQIILHFNTNGLWFHMDLKILGTFPKVERFKIFNWRTEPWIIWFPSFLNYLILMLWIPSKSMLHFPQYTLTKPIKQLMKLRERTAQIQIAVCKNVSWKLQMKRQQLSTSFDIWGCTKNRKTTIYC